MAKVILICVAIGQRWQYSRGTGQFCTWQLATLVRLDWNYDNACNIHMATGQFCTCTRPTLLLSYVTKDQHWLSLHATGDSPRAFGQHWYFFPWRYVKTWPIVVPLLVTIGECWQYSRGTRQFFSWHLANTGTSFRGTMSKPGTWPKVVPLLVAIG